MILAAWPTIPALCALLLVIAEYSGRLSSRTPRTPKWPAWWWIAGLIASFVAQLAIVYYAATHEYPMAPWRLTMMPLPVVDKPGADILHGNLVSLGMLALAAFQSYALLALYRLTPSRAVVWAGCAVMLLLSCAAPALISSDLYGYVHDAMLGLTAYYPPRTPFPGEYHVFDLWYGVGDSTLYGPLWLTVAPLVTFAAPTLLGKLLALRLFSLLLFVALLAGLRALGMPARITRVAALNPALMLQFVADGHNDLIPLALLVWAAVLARTRSWAPLAFALVAAAGLVKIQYAVVGLPIVALMRPGWARLAGSAVTLTVVGALWWLVGGTGILRNLSGHVHEFSPVTTNPAHELAGLAALALILSAVIGARRLRSGVWLIAMVSPAIYSWYFLWALPYALARRRILGYFLVCFPFVSMLVGSAFMRIWELNVVLPVVAMLSIRLSGKPSRRADAETPGGNDARAGYATGMKGRAWSRRDP